MSNLLSSLLKEAPHDQTRSHLRVLHHHLFDKHHQLWLQKASIIDLELVVVDHLKLIHTLIQADLVIPLESNVDRTGALSWLSFRMVIEVSITEARLVPQMTSFPARYFFS